MNLQKIREAIDSMDFDGKKDIVLVADLLAFLPGEFRQHAPEIKDFYGASLPHVENAIKYVLIDGTGRPRKAKLGDSQLVLNWADHPEDDRNIFAIDLESGSKSGEVSDRAFQMYFDGADPGFLRTILPAEIAYEEPDTLLELVLGALEGVRFLSAYAGFSVNMERQFPASFPTSKIAAISKRFRGVHLGRPLMFARYLKEHVMCANWLTALGQPLIEKLGGIDTLAKTAKDVRLHKVEHGVVLQAGDRPQFGDVNRGDKLDSYLGVGKLLEPIRIPESVLGVYDGIGGTENTREWLARFDSVGAR